MNKIIVRLINLISSYKPRDIIHFLKYPKQFTLKHIEGYIYPPCLISDWGMRPGFICQLPDRFLM